MKVLVVLASFGMLVSAAPNFNQQQFSPPQAQQQQQPLQQSNGYNGPSQTDRLGYGAPSAQYGNPHSGYPSPGGYAGGGGLGGPGPGVLSGGVAPVIHKHVYVHVPPPEPQAPRLRRPVIPPPPPQKHYKIIFIKAPTPPPPEIPEIPLIPQTETKTLVYVLVKKPEPAPPIRIPAPPPTKPSKPEVYFIRYKTPGGGDAAVVGGGPGGLGPVDYSSGGADIGSNTIGTDYGTPVQEYGAPSY